MPFEKTDTFLKFKSLRKEISEYVFFWKSTGTGTKLLTIRTHSDHEFLVNFLTKKQIVVLIIYVSSFQPIQIFQ